MPPDVMTIDQVAEYLQLHPQVVYRHVRAGTLPASRIGRTIRFKKSVLDAFLEQGAWEFANQYLTYVARAKSVPSQPVEIERRDVRTQITSASARSIVIHETNLAGDDDATKQFSTEVD